MIRRLRTSTLQTQPEVNIRTPPAGSRSTSTDWPSRKRRPWRWWLFSMAFRTRSCLMRLMSLTIPLLGLANCPHSPILKSRCSSGRPHRRSPFFRVTHCPLRLTCPKQISAGVSSGPEPRTLTCTRSSSRSIQYRQQFQNPEPRPCWLVDCYCTGSAPQGYSTGPEETLRQHLNLVDRRACVAIPSNQMQAQGIPARFIKEASI